MNDVSPPLLRTRRGLVFTALPAIAVLAALGALLAVAHRDSAIGDRKDEIRSLAAAAATNVSRFAGDQLATLGAAALAPSVRRGDLRAIRPFVGDVATVGRFTSGVGYVDRSLTVRAFSGGLPGGRPFSARSRGYVRTALRRHRRVVSDVILALTTGRPIIAFATPVQGPRGGTSGVLTGSIRLDEIDRAVRRLLYDPDAGETLLDGHDHVVVGDGPVRGIRPAPAGFDVAAMRRAQRGVLSDVHEESERQLAGFSTVPGLSWLVIVERPYADVVGPLDAALAAEIFALIVLAGAGVLITFAGGRRLDRLDAERDAALAEQRSIALRLQRSLLPEVPAPPAVDVHADYTPAAGTMSVGGDWYDVVDLPDGRVALSMGDVAGHGLGAAAAMGQLRSAARMLALGRHEPADAIERLDDFAQMMDGRPLATVIYAILEPATGRLRYACAGHPPPLVVRADGTTEFLRDGRSPLLGVDPLEPRAIGAVTLRPGDTLICYTDGLVERPDRSLDEGLNAMAQTAAVAASDPQTLAQRLLEQVQEPRRDDAAVLCVRLATRSQAEVEPQPSSVPS